MDPHAITLPYTDELTALRSGGVSDGLAGVIVDALRQHDAAGRPPIALPSPEEAWNDHQLRAALAPLFIASAAALDGLPEQAEALAAAVERDGIEGARSFVATLDPEIGAKLSATLDLQPFPIA